MIKKLIFGIAVAVSVCYAETTNLETEHFKICETCPQEKIVIKYEDFVSPELDCVNIYQSKAKELTKNELLLSSVIGHGTGFNVEKLFIIQVVDDTANMNFIEKIFSLKKRKLMIYSLSNEEIFNQLRKRTKFEITKNRLRIIIDNKEVYEGSIKMGENYYVDYCDEYFTFNLDNKLSLTVGICKKKKDEATYPDFIGDMKFEIAYKIENKELHFSLKKPIFKI